MSVTVYTFEDSDGVERTFTTQDATEAQDHARKHQFRCIANHYECTSSDVAWDFAADEHDPDDESDPD